MNMPPTNLSRFPATPTSWNQLAPCDGRAHEVVLAVGDDDVWHGYARIERWAGGDLPDAALRLSVGKAELASVGGARMSSSLTDRTGSVVLEGASEDGQVTLKVMLAPADTPTSESVSVRYS